jgi:hypothetical protein
MSRRRTTSLGFVSASRCVYEKLAQGIWSYNGLLHLVDSWQEVSDRRTVFKFKLVTVEEQQTSQSRPRVPRRLIPTAVKRTIWKRDQGRCVKCGATEILHFDHDIPFSKGGSSFTTENVQILCARHNLRKGARIE